jgi:hypothetical protein
VIVRDIPNGRPVPPTGKPVAGGVPRYYVTLYQPPASAQSGTATIAPPAVGSACAPGQPGCPVSPGTELLVGDTFTGAKLAVVPAPRGATFDGIAAAADDRTFVADTQGPSDASDFTLPRTWYLLRIAPGTSSPAKLTKLAIPSLRDVVAMALSGSGRELAVATQGTAPIAKSGATNQVRIYSVTTGKMLHSWSTKNPGVFGEAAYFAEQSRTLAWIDGDRAVAFFASSEAEPPALIAALGRLNKEKGLSRTERIKQLLALEKRYGEFTLRNTWRRLDVATGGGDLMADSKVIWSRAVGTYSSGCQYGWTELISADGKTVVCGSVAITPGRWRLASPDSGGEATFARRGRY